jgi:hypothetical protein
MKKSVGICPKCGVTQKLTKHHVLPKRHFGSGGQTLDICRLCHDELEKLIPQERLEAVIAYYRIIIHFLNGGSSYD